MKKIISLFVLAALAVSLVGCGTTGGTANGPSIGAPLVRLGVSTGAAYSLLKYTNALPAVKASAAIICSQAHSTNLAPAAVVEAINAYHQQTPESVLIVNSALTLYTTIWNSYGTVAVTNYPTLRLYLEATCDGLNDAIASVPSPGVVRNAVPNKAWPQVKFK